MIEGLAATFQLTVVARRIEGGVEISHPPAVSVPTVVGPASRVAFARFAHDYLTRHSSTFDAVLVQGYSLAALAANLVGRARRIPTSMLVCSPTELYYLCRRSNPQPGKPFRAHELLGLRLLAAVNARLGQRYIVLSDHLAEVVRSHGGRLPIETIPIYGVDTDRFHPPAAAKAEVKARLGLPTDGALIFFSSRIAPEKDSETLLAAVRAIRERGRSVWVLHRSGGFRSFLASAERYGVADRVIATDAVHPHRELPLDYQASDVCVQASREEGLGFSPLEALATEVPVIATRVGGLRETVVDGRTGWTYPVGDVDALAARIEEVLDDPATAARRAAEGRRLVVERYRSTSVFQRLREALAAASEPLGRSGHLDRPKR